MGFAKNWDVDNISSQLRRMASEAGSAYNDGYTSSYCKHELYQIKCLIEDLYKDLPIFANESDWEKARVAQLLARK